MTEKPARPSDGAPEEVAASGRTGSGPPRSRLYTRTGDDGSTGLFAEGRVGKEHPRIEAYGSVDELNAVIGWVRVLLQKDAAAPPGHSEAASPQGTGRAAPGIEIIARVLAELQHRLFELGADLATPPDSKFADRVSRMSAADVAEAERWIDEVDAGNEPLRTFVLPGGSELASRLHVARTVARRAERAMVALTRHEQVGEAAIRFINRVSDLLFALARRANRELGVPDVPWTARSSAQ